ncbi:5' nucleotidase, NT5C type [Paenibacillus lutrae]|uniref:HAD hydrolase family protein n=1 Tax=Paenibacillus lutrae TaxID=2078573 RepID=A0A7X3JYE7_9BACL|nr:HAD hydrolase family protein [Paenibacillus lutrae]MVO98835.1 HAD hydrolase family protein [Paenibacillus lutrae]
MRVVIDLDGTICTFRGEGQTYADVTPIPGALDALRRMKSEGHYLIIHTARHMKTCGGNVGEVVAKVGAITLDWLRIHEVPYDEIVFGKPQGDLYVDDLALAYRNWDEVLQTLDIR